jgi:hypothetical protein
MGNFSRSSPGFRPGRTVRRIAAGAGLTGSKLEAEASPEGAASGRGRGTKGLRTTGAPAGGESLSLGPIENGRAFGGKGKSRSGRQDGIPSRQ